MSSTGSHCATIFNLWRSSEPNQDSFLKKSKVRKDIPFQLPSEYSLCWSWAKVVKNQLNQAKALNNEIIVNIKLYHEDALVNIAAWLYNAENQLANIINLASTIQDNLDNQIRKLKSSIS